MKSNVMSPNIQINTLAQADFSGVQLLVRSSPHRFENMTTRAGFLVPRRKKKSRSLSPIVRFDAGNDVGRVNSLDSAEV